MDKLDWNLLRAFHATATAGSLSAAARQLGLTQPTLSRQIQALEEDLGVSLFERRGRSLAMTPAGINLCEHAQTMGKAADAMMLTVNGLGQDVSGRVCISVTDTYSAYILPKIVDRIKTETPQITIEIVVTNELSNLHQMEADIAIRHVKPDQPSLVGEYVRDTKAYFYASKEWVTRNGLPKNLADLAKAGLIGYDDTKRMADYMQSIGIPIEASDFRVVSDSYVSVWEMVKSGIGIAVVVQEIAERTPGIVNVLPDMQGISVPIWLVTHQELQSTPRIRIVHQILADELAKM